jgi:hypothetical protein
MLYFKIRNLAENLLRKQTQPGRWRAWNSAWGRVNRQHPELTFGTNAIIVISRFSGSFAS